MNKAISTNSLPPIKEHEPKEATMLTTNKIQPNRTPDVSNEARRRFKGRIITSRNIEQIQAENRRLGEQALATVKTDENASLAEAEKLLVEKEAKARELQAEARADAEKIRAEADRKREELVQEAQEAQDKIRPVKVAPKRPQSRSRKQKGNSR